MSFKIRIVVLASAAAIATAAPAVFAQDGGKWDGDFFVAEGGTPEAPAATYTRQVMEKFIAPSEPRAASGSWNKDFYTEAAGTPDAPAATYSRAVIQKQAAARAPSALASLPWVPRY